MVNNGKRDDEITLAVLEAINDESEITQRYLAQRLGVALGLTNSYIKRCIRKGLIKIHQAPANRYMYYLTPKGFAEKSRLTAQYLTYSLGFYRTASDSCTRCLVDCTRLGWRSLLLCGISELGEIAYIRSRESKISVLGTFDPDTDTTAFMGLPVWKHLAKAPPHDACIITSLTSADRIYDVVSARVDPSRVLVPDILGISVEDEPEAAARRSSN